MAARIEACTYCGARHRSEDVAAKCAATALRSAERGDAVRLPATPAGEVRVEVEDVIGVLTLMDGRLVRVGDSGVLAVSPTWLTIPIQPPLHRQFAHQNDVVRMLLIVSGLHPMDAVPALNRAIRLRRALTTVFDREHFAEVAEELTRMAQRSQSSRQRTAA